VAEARARAIGEHAQPDFGLGVEPEPEQEGDQPLDM
jgi:hypothetical protein